MNVTKINKDLLRVSDALQQVDNAIAEIYFTEVPNYGQLIKLLSTDDTKSYRTIDKAFNFVVDQYNSLINRHVLIDPYGNRAQGMGYLHLSNLSVRKVDSKVQEKLKQMNGRVDFVISAVDSMGIHVEIKPDEPEKPVEPPKEPDKPKPPVVPEKPKEPEVKLEVPQLKPFPTQVINRGWKRVKEFPERGWPGIQGTGIDNEWYYTFGKRSNADTKLRLIVTNRFDNKKSFIATGDIGDYDNWDKEPTKNPLGHTNGVTMLSKTGNEVTLLIATMHTGQVATAIVNLGKKTVRTGRTTTLVGSAGETIGAVTSVQKIADGKILFKASNHYWWGEYNPDRIVVTKAFKWNNATALAQIRKLFGQNFVKSVVGQADWYEDGYLYSISWSDNWEKCFVFELIPDGPNNTAIWSNRMWWDEVKGRRFEPENIWFEGNQMKSGISMNTPYDAFIAELNFKK